MTDPGSPIKASGVIHFCVKAEAGKGRLKQHQRTATIIRTLCTFSIKVLLRLVISMSYLDSICKSDSAGISSAVKVKRG